MPSKPSKNLAAWVKKASSNAKRLDSAFPEWLYVDERLRVARRGNKLVTHRKLQPREWAALKEYHINQYRLISGRAVGAAFRALGIKKQPKIERIINHQMEELISARHALIERRIPERMYAGVRGWTFYYIGFIMKKIGGEKAAMAFNEGLSEASGIVFQNDLWNPLAKFSFEKDHSFEEDPNQETEMEKEFRKDMLDKTWQERARLKARLKKSTRSRGWPENN